MSINKVLAGELDYRRYVTELGLNPDNVYYQKIQSNNISTSNAQWTITSPNKRSFLLSYAAVNWRPTIRLEDNTDAKVDWDDNMYYASVKPGLAFANAMSSITMSVNGNTITLSQPRRFMETLTTACVNREEARVCFESGYPEAMGGIWSDVNPGRGSIAQHDQQFDDNESQFKNKLFRSAGDASTTWDDLNDAGQLVNKTNGFQEPLIVPPFNPFAKLTEGMPGYMWFKNMSPVIPNIDRLEIDIQFTKLSPSVLYPRFAEAAAERRLAITALAADLYLYWYEVPVNMSIPRSIDLQTWNVREFSKVVPNGPVGNNTLIPTLSSDLIQLNSTPTLIGIHIEVNKDSNTYTNTFKSTGSNYAGADDDVVNNDCWDAFAEIKTVEITLGDRPNVIGTSFTQQELYYLTQKNSKLPYPYSFNDWRGRSELCVDETGVPVTTNHNYSASKCVVLLRPKDIAEKISDGVFAPNAFQVTVTGITRYGTHNYSVGSHNLTFFVHLYYGKHFLRIEPDKAQYQEQSIPLDTARRITNPVLETQGVSGLGSGLEGLRLRAEPNAGGGYQSRV